MPTEPKTPRRPRPATKSGAEERPGERPAFLPFSPGAFVRECEHPGRWGRLVGPGTEPQRWLVQYSTGARMTAGRGELEEFSPTTAEQAVLEKATKAFERAMRRLGAR